MSEPTHHTSSRGEVRSQHHLTSPEPPASLPVSRQPEPPRPALLQDTSLFFAKLPREIRELIYAEYLHDIGSGQHVFKHGDGTFAFCGCLTDHEAIDDGRDEGLDAVWRAAGCPTSTNPIILNPDSSVPKRWSERLVSPWGNHWRCREGMLNGTLPLNPTLGMLLSCKRMHNEFSRILLRTLSYIFTDYATITDAFLARRPRLLWQVTTIKASFCRAHDLLFAIDQIPDRWKPTCDVIDGLEHLKNVSIWFAALQPAPCYVPWQTEGDWYAWTARLPRTVEKMTISLPAKDDDFVIAYGREQSPKSTFLARGRFNYQASSPHGEVRFSSNGFVSSYHDGLNAWAFDRLDDYSF